MKKGAIIDGKSYPLTKYGFISAVSRKESSSDLGLSLSSGANIRAAKTKNNVGYIGLFQFGEAALIDLGYYVHWDKNSDKTKANDWTGRWTGKNGISSLSSFLDNPKKQLQIINEWIELLCSRLRNKNFNEFYGKTINGVEITESGAIAGAHLVGDGGLGSFLGVPGYKGKYKEQDGNNIHISKYINLFNHYDLEDCCKRKIYIQLKNQLGQIVKNKQVTIESEYKGKFNQPKFIINAQSNEQGYLPVIVRHPDSQIVIKVDGKRSKTIIQKKDQKQVIELNISEEVKIEAVLEKPATPQPKKNVIVVEQESKTTPDTIQEQKSEVKFDLSIIEADTRKKITNMKFFLKYKGKIKQHQTDNTGVTQGILAEEGENIDILVNGKNDYQKIKTISVNKSIENTCVSVPLSIVTTKLKILSSDGKILKNNRLYISYRGREIEKVTNNEGIIQLKTLNAFVYKLLLANKQAVLTSRVDARVSVINVTLNEKATTTQKIASNTKESVPASNQKSTIENLIDFVAEFVPSLGKTENIHTEKNGNPLSKQYGTDVSFTIKTINKETGQAENLFYTIRYNGAAKNHCSGQDGVGLKKHRAEEGKKIEIVVNSDGKDEILYTTTLKNPMPIIELRIKKPKDDGSYLFPLKKRVDSYKKSYAQFGSRRGGGKRAHAGCDLYAPAGTEVRAMADGVVRSVKEFYDNTDAIEIIHNKHIIRYGEVMIGKSLVKAGDKVVKGQVIGYVGNLTTKGIPSMMLHLEMYSDPTDNGTLSGTTKYRRRADLIDPTPFLDRASL